MREWRKTHRLSGESLARARARSYAGTYYRRGKLMRPDTCADCSAPPEEMHHEDYSKPLEVTWLCCRCHRRRERERREARRAQTVGDLVRALNGL
jgi:hypothetical protein